MATNWTSYDVDRAVFENFARLQGCANDPMEKSRLWMEFERFSKYGSYDFNWERPKPWTAEQTADLNRTLQRKRHADELRRRGHYHEPSGQVERGHRDERLSAPTSEMGSKLSPESAHCPTLTRYHESKVSRPHNSNAVSTNSSTHRSSELSSERCTSRLPRASKEPFSSTQPDPSSEDDVSTEDQTWVHQEAAVEVQDQFASRPQTTAEEMSSTTQSESTVADQSSPLRDLSEVKERWSVVPIERTGKRDSSAQPAIELDKTDHKAQPEFPASTPPRSGSTVKERASPRPASDVNAETAETRPDSDSDFTTQEDERSSTPPPPIGDFRRSSRPEPMPSEDEQSTHSDLTPNKSSSPASTDESVEDWLPARLTGNRPKHDALSGNAPRNMDILIPILWIGLHGRFINLLGNSAGVRRRRPHMKSGMLMLRLFIIGACYVPP